MAQQAQNNIFVREWILKVKDSANQVWATIDWIRARKIRKHNLKGITLFGQVRGWSVLIFTQVYLSTRCSFFSSFFLRLLAPFFMGAFPLYGPIIFNPNPPLANHVGDFLDACPIRNLLENLWVAVNWDIFAHRSFPHKCGQLVRCRTFNAMVAAFSPYISSFVVRYLPWSLSIKGRVTSCTAFQGRLSSNLPQRFPEEARLLENYYQLVVILSRPQLIDPQT